MAGHVAERGEVAGARVIELQEEAVVRHLGEDGLRHPLVAALGPPAGAEVPAAEVGAHREIGRAVPEGGPHQSHRPRQHRVGILATRAAVFPHALVTEVGQAHVVELEIPAARRVEIRDLGPVGGRGILHELVEVRVHAVADVGAAHLGVEHAGRRQRDLGGAAGGRAQEAERVDEDRRGPAHPSLDAQVGTGEGDVAPPAVEGHRQRAALAGEPAQAGEEVHVPRLPPLLAIGDALESGALLDAHRLADRLVLRGGQGRPVDAPRRVLQAPCLERGRAQQAAHVVGAERRSGRAHAR